MKCSKYCPPHCRPIPADMTEELSAVIQHQRIVAFRARRQHPLRMLVLALREGIRLCARVGSAALPVSTSRPDTLEPEHAATSVSHPRAANSRSSVHRICSAPPALSSLTGSSG